MTDFRVGSSVWQSPWTCLAIFLATVLVVLIFWAALPAALQQNESADYFRSYEPVARRVVDGNGLTNADGTVAIRYPPGFPLLLAGIFASAKVLNVREDLILSAFNLVCMGTASVILFMLSKTIWGVGPALLSSFLWMTYPLGLWFTKQPSASLPFLVFVYGGFYFFVIACTRHQRRGEHCFLSGVLLGISMLIRPITIGVVLALAAALYTTAKDMKPCLRLSLIAMMLTGNLIAILPWEGWVYFKTGKVILLSSGAAPAVLDGLTYGARPEHRSEEDKDLTKLMEDIRDNRARIKNSFLAIALTILEKLRTEPLVFAKLYATKAARAWYGTDSGRFESLLMLIQAPYLLLAVLASILAWKRGGDAKKLTVSVWFVAAYFWVMATVALSIARYMVAAMGLLFLLTPSILPERVRRATAAGI